ncbi:MAG: adenylate/guanylate cyclase domain-containing protein [Chloroflexi bacterium]|nr:adenylate/guanylate cyclase domain-containing protein [Chloroflexota bacterium]MCL5110001.1 adenylate/guanylate cyclase domain-containing protein [Chloroflexota bacterium]
MANRERTTAAPTEPAKLEPARRPFARLVHDALAHLYDPVYLQTHPLAQALRRRRSLAGPSFGQALRQEIVAAIEDLSPGDQINNPSAARGARVLSLRYVEALDAVEVQRQLSLSSRQYFREHRRALAAVISLLRERWAVHDEESFPSEGALPALAAVESPKHNLPMELTSFVGREKELAEVKSLLSSTRLLTLTGTGGCGKTRLALKLAASVLDEYPDGVWLVELALLADGNLMAQTVASVLGLREEAGRAPLQALIAYLRFRHLLLVLDNCEHLVVAAAALASSLLLGCPRLTILATSREVLGVPGETLWYVPSLAVPRDGLPTNPRDVARCESVRLFTERARVVRPSFGVTAENALAVAQVCRRLDGMPLAIELAAARVRLLSVDQLARRLDDRFNLLTAGSRTALHRHQTLRATIDWSYDLLTDGEKRLLRRLSVFTGGWTLEAAEAVCCGDGVAKKQVLSLLGQLADKSLVQVEDEPEEQRYRLLETIRQYAEEKLQLAEETASLRAAHCNWCVSFAERELPHTVGQGQSHCLSRLAAEHGNFRSALTFSQRDPEGAEAELRLAAAVARHWRWVGRWTEARYWLDDVLARCGKQVSEARARALTTRGNIEWAYFGNLDLALELAEEGVAQARLVGDPRLLAIAVRQAGLVLASRGAREAASSAFDEATLIAQRSGDTREACSCLAQKAIMCHDPSDLGAIVQTLDQAHAMARTLGDAVLLTEILSFLGGALVGARDYSRAGRFLGEALACARQIGYQDTISWSIAMLGDIALFSGDRATALVRYGEALERELDRGNEGLADEALARVAALAVEKGSCESAARLLAWCDAQRERRASIWTRFLVDKFGTSEFAAVNEQALAAARAGLGEAAFAGAWEAGRAMTPEEVGELGKALLVDLRESPTSIGC